MALHVKPLIRPSILDGQNNGALTAGVLMAIPHERPTNVVGYQLVIPAARAYIAMHAKARAEGVILKPSSSADTYRPLWVQKATFEQRYSVDGTCGGCKTCSGYTSRCKKRQANGLCPATAACPGTSNHGWGLAVDVGTELDGDSGAESIDARTLNWLEVNAWSFGFSWSLLPEEPWHIQYCTGDLAPQAVLDYWAPDPPPPDPPDPPPPSGRMIPLMYRLRYKLDRWPGAFECIIEPGVVRHAQSGNRGVVDSRAGVPIVEGSREELIWTLEDASLRHISINLDTDSAQNPFSASYDNGNYHDTELELLWARRMSAE